MGIGGRRDDALLTDTGVGGTGTMRDGRDHLSTLPVEIHERIQGYVGFRSLLCLGVASPCQFRLVSRRVHDTYERRVRVLTDAGRFAVCVGPGPCSVGFADRELRLFALGENIELRDTRLIAAVGGAVLDRGVDARGFILLYVSGGVFLCIPRGRRLNGEWESELVQRWDGFGGVGAVCCSWMPYARAEAWKTLWRHWPREEV